MIYKFVVVFIHTRVIKIGTIKNFIDKPDSKHPIEDPNSVRILGILDHNQLLNGLENI